MHDEVAPTVHSGENIPLEHAELAGVHCTLHSIGRSNNGNMKANSGLWTMLDSARGVIEYRCEKC